MSAGADDPFQIINQSSIIPAVITITGKRWKYLMLWMYNNCLKNGLDGMFLSEVSYLACEASSKSSVSCVSVRALPRVSQSLPAKIFKIRKMLKKKYKTKTKLLPAGWL